MVGERMVGVWVIYPGLMLLSFSLVINISKSSAAMDIATAWVRVDV